MDNQITRAVLTVIMFTLTSCKAEDHQKPGEDSDQPSSEISSPPPPAPVIEFVETRPEIFALVRHKFFDRMPEILSLPGIHGITLYTSLARVEPSEDVYDWEDLDAAVEAATKAGIPVHLAVLGGRWTPEWVYEKGAKKFEWTHSTTLVDPGTTHASAPVPWDTVYLGVMAEMAVELGKRYGANPLITGVQITGPALANGLETNFVVSEDTARALGFSPEAYIEAWVTMGEAFGQAFPDKQLYIALSNEIAGRRDERIPRTIRSRLEKALGDRLTVTVFYLTHEPWFAKGNPAVDIWREGRETRKAAQMIAIYSEKKLPPQDLGKAIQRARDMNAELVEVWVEDLLLPDYRAAVDSRSP